jgi:hypothetical protein
MPHVLCAFALLDLSAVGSSSTLFPASLLLQHTMQGRSNTPPNMINGQRPSISSSDTSSVSDDPDMPVYEIDENGHYSRKVFRQSSPPTPGDMLYGTTASDDKASPTPAATARLGTRLDALSKSTSALSIHDRPSATATTTGNVQQTQLPRSVGRPSNAVTRPSRVVPSARPRAEESDDRDRGVNGNRQDVDHGARMDSAAIAGRAAGRSLSSSGYYPTDGRTALPRPTRVVPVAPVASTSMSRSAHSNQPSEEGYDTEPGMS